LIPYLDAVKVDLKGFNEDYYQKVVGGKLEPVLETLKTLSSSRIHYEIVTLLVTGKNDTDEDITAECQWIKDNLGDSVPLHFSRFSPAYKLSNLPPTPEETIKKARQICANLGLKYVYTGNISDEEGSATFCPDNGKPLIIRKGFFISNNKLNNLGESVDCPTNIPGVWQ
jgi:pyruvate formate lyase activating enzyme